MQVRRLTLPCRNTIFSVLIVFMIFGCGNTGTGRCQIDEQKGCISSSGRRESDRINSSLCNAVEVQKGE